MECGDGRKPQEHGRDMSQTAVPQTHASWQSLPLVCVLMLPEYTGSITHKFLQHVYSQRMSLKVNSYIRGWI